MRPPSLLAEEAHLLARNKASQVLLSLSSTCRSLVVTVILVPPEKDCVAISWLLRTSKLFLVPLAVAPDALGGNSTGLSLVYSQYSHLLSIRRMNLSLICRAIGIKLSRSESRGFCTNLPLAGKTFSRVSPFQKCCRISHLSPLPLRQPQHFPSLAQIFLALPMVRLKKAARKGGLQAAYRNGLIAELPHPATNVNDS